MEERRRYKRQVLVMYLHVFDRTTGKVVGYLGDISAHGLMLVSEAPLPRGQDMALGIRLHTWDTDMHYVNVDEHRHIACDGETRWSRPLAEESLYTTGVMFTFVSAADQAEITHLIERIGKADDLTQDSHLYLDAMLQIGATAHAKDCAATSLVTQNGVMSVLFDDAAPHLLVVQYHRDRTTPADIMRHLHTQGFSSRLVSIS